MVNIDFSKVRIGDLFSLGNPDGDETPYGGGYSGKSHGPIGFYVVGYSKGKLILYECNCNLFFNYGILKLTKSDSEKINIPETHQIIEKDISRYHEWDYKNISYYEPIITKKELGKQVFSYKPNQYFICSEWREREIINHKTIIKSIKGSNAKPPKEWDKNKDYKCTEYNFKGKNIYYLIEDFVIKKYNGKNEKGFIGFIRTKDSNFIKNTPKKGISDWRNIKDLKKEWSNEQENKWEDEEFDHYYMIKFRKTNKFIFEDYLLK